MSVTTHLWHIPPYPTQNLAGQVYIVTGSNTGLGLEAAKHFVRLGASKTILAVRNEAAGKAAAADIEAANGRTGVTEVWLLDMARYESVKAFANRMEGEPRIDGLVLNAGVAPMTWRMAEDNELAITVNVVSTMFLATVGIPILEKSARRYNIKPRISITSSNAAAEAKFPERNAPNILEALRDPSTWNFSQRYRTTKQMEILSVRELARQYNRSSNGKPAVIVNTLSPGFCASGLVRELKGPATYIVYLMHTLLARTTERGGRTLVLAALADKDTHGRYMGHGFIYESEVIPWTFEADGERAQKELWQELSEKFEELQTGSTKYLAN